MERVSLSYKYKTAAKDTEAEDIKIGFTILAIIAVLVLLFL